MYHCGADVVRDEHMAFDAARVTDSSCNASDKKRQTVGSSADFPAVGILVFEP